MNCSDTATESQMILDFFDEDLWRQYEIYHHFRVNGNYSVAVEMRKEIEKAVKEDDGYAAWWKEVLAEERFADF